MQIKVLTILLFLLGIGFFYFPQQVHAAYQVEIDSVSTPGRAAAGTVTWNHTTGDHVNKLLEVFITTAGNRYPTSVTYNGILLDNLNNYLCGNGTNLNPGCTASLWGMLNPPEGTHPIVVRGTNTMYTGAVSYYNVDQTDVVENALWTARDLSCTLQGSICFYDITGIGQGGLLVIRTSIYSQYSLPTLRPGTGQTLTYNASSSDNRYISMVTTKHATRATDTMYWTPSSSISWYFDGFDIYDLLKLAPPNTIRGSIFNDSNKNGIKDSGESNYAGTPSIVSSQGTVSTTSSGTYTISGIIPGNGPVTVSYTNLPSDYNLTFPKNGPPPSFQVSTGVPCDTGSSGASCTVGNISNLNFGINNLYPWFQTVCGGIRMDDGITNLIPSSASLVATNANCMEPGIVVIGDSVRNFNKDAVSSRKWLVGGTTYPEVYNPNPITGVSTSYKAVSDKVRKGQLPITDLKNVCALTNCTLPTLPHGIYRSEGDLTLNAFTTPANQNYVILVGGNLTLKGPISVPTTSTLIFSVSGNITVDPTLGVAANSTTSSLDGIYSTDKSFILPSSGACTDRRLNIAGNLVINASQTTGTLQNLRDLCTNNATYPSIAVTQRLDFLLNLPEFLKVSNVVSREGL